MKGLRICLFIVAGLLTRITVGDGGDVWMTRALMDISWSTNQDEPFSTMDLYKFEDATAYFLKELIESQVATGHQHLHMLRASVIAIDQQLHTTEAFNLMLLQLWVELEYTANQGLEQAASLLHEVTESHEGTGLRGILTSLKLIDESVTKMSLSFANPDDPSKLLYHVPEHETIFTRSGADKGLIVATTFLLLTLVIVTGVLVWFTGLCANVRCSIPTCFFKMNRNMMNRTPYGHHKRRSAPHNSDPRQLQNPEGTPNSINPTMSPTRGLYREDEEIFSPLSQNTNLTNMTNNGGENPLGILSMRKLTRFRTPQPSDYSMDGNGGVDENNIPSSTIRISKLTYT